LFISAEVVRELSSPDFPEEVRQPALDMLPGLGAVALDDAVIGFSEILVREKVMPRPALKGDALHLAAATIHRLDYLVTWNQQHLANPNKRTHFAVVCYRMNLPAPQIVTPDLLMTEADHA